jgi:hypothetical protein
MDLAMSHRDPFDRLLASQALAAGYVFISNDAAVDGWGGEEGFVRISQTRPCLDLSRHSAHGHSESTPQNMVSSTI